MTDEKPKRVFLAIDLPDDVKESVIAVQKKLTYVLQGVRWVRPEGIHLTLKFFGNIYENDISRISVIVARASQNAEVLTLKSGKIGAFPNPERPRVLWLGLTGDVEKLSALQNVIEKDLEVSGYKREGRKFRPHLTLGRAKSSRGMILGLSEAINGDDYNFAGCIDVAGLTLFQSELKPGGAVYTKLAYFPLGG